MLRLLDKTKMRFYVPCRCLILSSNVFNGNVDIDITTTTTPISDNLNNYNFASWPSVLAIAIASV